jgi:hypothetical protein
MYCMAGRYPTYINKTGISICCSIGEAMRLASQHGLIEWATLVLQ